MTDADGCYWFDLPPGVVGGDVGIFNSLKPGYTRVSDSDGANDSFINAPGPSCDNDFVVDK